ncbi:MAG: hypothetical protein H6Q20_1605 [Bacteroidetes bacterium]|nr:hypothetical protein [Bacteroidota bacterium]
MKNLNLLVKHLLVIVSLLFVSSAFGEEVKVPLKPDSSKAGDIGPGTPIRTNVLIPLSVAINDYELALFFDSNVGLVTVSVYDEDDNIEYSEVINTNTESEFYLDLSDLASGTHTLKISYGSVRLVGEFELP